MVLMPFHNMGLLNSSLSLLCIINNFIGDQDWHYLTLSGCKVGFSLIPTLTWFPDTISCSNLGTVYWQAKAY